MWARRGQGAAGSHPTPGRGRPWHAGRALRLGTKAGSVSFEVLLPAWQPRRPQQFTATYARLFLASAPQMTGVCSEGPRTGCSSPRPQPLEKARGGMPSPAPTPAAASRCVSGSHSQLGPRPVSSIRAVTPGLWGPLGHSQTHLLKIPLTETSSDLNVHKHFTK